ncbi:MAG TPA: SRPBCC family protein [Myxococcales bacterium]|nr:SRPBCC family protein [Myxococcales bacterium]HIL02499.1 SRPBCC family protein [Myxococcales bacterium]
MEVKVTENFAASGESIWELLRDFGGILRWNSNGIESVSVEGEGVGAVRTIGIPGGIQLQEKLEAHDEAARSFSYSFAGKPVIPFDNYYATMTVIDEGESMCRVDWESTFEHPSMEKEAARQLIEGIYLAGFSALKETVEG